MKIPVLADLTSEVNRLFVAGAKLSAGDPRLDRLLPMLEKMGERAPVFKKLAADTSELISSPPEESGERLLSLGTLLYSILYTQGETSAEGEYTVTQAECAPSPDDVCTDINYGRLHPLLEALTAQKPGRLEVIQSSYDSGLFRDLRTHGAAVRALDDKYAELAALMEQTIIPGIGAAAIPHLLAMYDRKGGQGDGRRLSLLGRLGYQHAERLARDAIDGDGTSVPVLVAAIEVLGRNPENEPLLTALSKDKKKELREAALSALVAIDSAQGKQILMETFNGKGYKAALAAMSRCEDRAVKLAALEAVSALEQELLSGGGEKKEQEARSERFLDCAATLINPLIREITEYMRHVLTSVKLRRAPSVGNWALQGLYRQYLEALYRLPYSESAAVLKALAEDTELTRFYSYGVQLWFLQAAQAYSPRDMYKEFLRHYRAGHLDAGIFCRAYTEPGRRESIDERWIDEFLKANGSHDREFAIELTETSEKRQVKKLAELLSSDLKEFERKKSRRLPHYIPALLEKLAAGGIDPVKELKPDGAQRILEQYGREVPQPIQEALNAIAAKK